jgi:hypothetical protein
VSWIRTERTGGPGSSVVEVPVSFSTHLVVSLVSYPLNLLLILGYREITFPQLL